MPVPDYWLNEEPGWSIPDQTVYINPVTGEIAQTTSPLQEAELEIAGFQRGVIPGTKWADFQKKFGSQIKVWSDQPATVPTFNVGSGLTQAEIDALQTRLRNQNSRTDTDLANLEEAFRISQPGRDRAALAAKQDYEAQVLPTMTSAAFAGAGYHQPARDLFLKARDRDRTLAGVADQNTSELFQAMVQANQYQRQREDNVTSLYDQASQLATSRAAKNISNIIEWFK